VKEKVGGLGLARLQAWRFALAALLAFGLIGASDRVTPVAGNQIDFLAGEGPDQAIRHALSWPLPPPQYRSLRHLPRLVAPRTRLLGMALDQGPEVNLLAPTLTRARVDSQIQLGFSAPMDQGSVENSFTISPSVQGKLGWSDWRTLVFQPDAPLAYHTTYTVSVAGLPAVGRKLVAAESIAFTTLLPPPNIPFPYTLTFDDCGTEAQIRAILDVLADRGVHAIFFPTGRCRDQFPWLIPTLVAAGHRVCNHTYSHPNLALLSAGQIQAEIAGGVSVNCNLFRPPYGSMDRGGRVYSVATSMGYQIQLWDVDTKDWAGTPADVMVAMIRARGGVVLMHMHGIHTLEALQKL
jgi:peptidoglycan/xylan/chitin deacetylase (PgdA/CDA1 family)